MRGPADAGFSHSPQGAFHFLCSPVFLCSVLTHPACFGIMNEHRPDGEIGRRSRLKICRQQCRTGSSPVLDTIAWGVSSAGRALRWQRRGQGFEPPTLHHAKTSLQVKHLKALFLYRSSVIGTVRLSCSQTGDRCRLTPDWMITSAVLHCEYVQWTWFWL